MTRATKRTDVHRPSAIKVDEYEWVCFEFIKIESLGDCFVIQEERARLRRHMERTGGTYSKHEHGGNCMICGNVLATYTILFYHEPTNSYVRAGQDCAQKLEMSYGSGWNAFKKGIADARHAVAGKRKAQATLTDAGLEAAWTLYASPVQVGDCDVCARIAAEQIERFYHRCTAFEPKEEQTIRDIVSKLVKYGSVSEKAMEHIKRNLGWIAERPAREEKRKAEREAAADCPAGRVDITGEVLKTRVDETDFGKVTKVLVRDDRGFKVWGTRPTIKTGVDEHGQMNYDAAERGDRISFSAVVTVSQEDAKFGFYKRPTKGKMILRATPALVAP